jgi:hypothetical protein
MRLTRRRQAALAVCGATLAATAFAVPALYGNSAIAVGGASRTIDAGPAIRALTKSPPRFPQIVDPFALAFADDARVATTTPPTAKPRKAVLRLRATVAGKERLALIDDGSSRIVTIGDEVDGTRIVGIDTDGVRLSDGRVVRIDGDPR